MSLIDDFKYDLFYQWSYYEDEDDFGSTISTTERTPKPNSDHDWYEGKNAIVSGHVDGKRWGGHIPLPLDDDLPDEFIRTMSESLVIRALDLATACPSTLDEAVEKIRGK